MTFIRSRTTRGRRTRVLTVAALAGVLTLSACGSGGSGGSAASGTYKIGLIAAETGPIAFAGASYLKGAELAVEEINESGYIAKGDKIEMLVEEGKEDPAQAINAANKLLSKDVLGTICCVLSPVAGAVKPAMKAQKAPLVIYGATLPGLNEPPYAYRSALLPQPGNELLAEEVVKKLDPANIAYVVTADNEGMQSQLKAFKGTFDKAGVKSLGTVNTLATDTDFSGPATKVVSLKPDAVVISTIGEPGAGMIKTLRDRGYTGDIIGNATISTKAIFDQAGKAIVGVPFPLEYAPISSAPEAKKFTEAYKAKFKVDADTYSSQGYTAMYMFADGLKKAAADGDVTRESLTKALESLTSMESVWGPVTIKDGQAEADQRIFATFDDNGALAPWNPSS